MFQAIVKAGMVTPGDPLVVGQAAGTLGLEVEETLGKSFAVVEGLSLRQGKECENGE